MHSTHNIKPAGYPPYRRAADRTRVISLTLQQVERENTQRVRRLQFVLGIAALLLLVNSTLVVTLS
jgi:hypothetical protein